MFLRISSVLLLAALAACAEQGSSEAGEKPGAVSAAVPCALAGAKTFTTSCDVERSSVDGKTILAIRHPDGGFRRLVELDSGKSFAAADGADDVAIEASGKEIEVTLGEDHYLFPAPATAAPAKGNDAAKP